MGNVRSRLESWLLNGGGNSRWRRQARAAMTHEVDTYLVVNVDVDPVEVLRVVDAAYPFGPRSHHPYKAWLAERKVLQEALGLTEKPVELPAPTDEDFAAVEVAIDLVAERGDVPAALKLMDEQAPRRLNRPCPVCDSKAGENCRDVETLLIIPVPHLSRIMPSRVNGPLFGGTP